MKISEQARKAAQKIYSVEGYEAVIQTAINDHERDLVEAARNYLNNCPLPLMYDTLQKEQRAKLKAALDRRRE